MKLTKRILWSLFFSFLTLRLSGIYNNPLGFLFDSLIFFGIFTLIDYIKNKYYKRGK